MSAAIRTVGLIGWGNAGRFFHAPLIRSTPGLELSAVVTTRPDAAAALPGTRIVTDTAVLFADPTLDLIVVASPHRLHVEHARAALEAGKHVVVEKPVAATAAEARDLFALATARGRKLIVFQNRRYDGDYLTLRQLLASDVLGTIYGFESHWQLYRPRLRGVWRESPDEMGGMLYDLGPHLIDQTIQLFGKPESVYAQLATNRPGNQVDDLCRLHLHYAGGLDAILTTDFMAPLPRARFRVQGTKGAYEKFGADPQEAALRAGQFPGGADWGVEEESAWGRLYVEDFGGVSYDGKIKTLPGDYRRFYETVRDSADTPTNADDILLQMAIIEASLVSARTNTVQLLS